MIICKTSTLQGQRLVKNQGIERVTTTIYLGHTLNDEWNRPLEIRCRVETARAAYIRMKNFLQVRI